MQSNTIMIATVAGNVLFLLLLQLMNPLLAKPQNQFQYPPYQFQLEKQKLPLLRPETPLSDPTCKISPILLQEFKNMDRTNFMVEMKNTLNTVEHNTDPVDDPDTSTIIDSSGESVTKLRASLIAKNEISQKNIVTFLEKEKAKRLKDNNGTDFTYDNTLWISNIIFVFGGDLKLAQDLAKFNEVCLIRQEIISGTF